MQKPWSKPQLSLGTYQSNLTVSNRNFFLFSDWLKCEKQDQIKFFCPGNDKKYNQNIFQEEEHKMWGPFSSSKILRNSVILHNWWFRGLTESRKICIIHAVPIWSGWYFWNIVCHLVRKQVFINSLGCVGHSDDEFLRAVCEFCQESTEANARLFKKFLLSLNNLLKAMSLGCTQLSFKVTHSWVVMYDTSKIYVVKVSK